MTRPGPVVSFCLCGVGMLVLTECAPLGDGGDSTPAFPPRVLDLVFLDNSTILIVSERDPVQGKRVFERSDDGGETWSFLDEAQTLADDVEEAIEHLVLGADQSIWGVWRRTGIGVPVYSRGIAISRDRGQSFRIIDLGGTGVVAVELIERSGADPLIIDGLGGQLWHKLRGSDDVAEGVVPLGIPHPDDSPATGIVCSETLFVAPSDPSEFTVTIWSSDDLAESWVSSTTNFAMLPRLTCGSAMLPWAILDEIVLRYDLASGAWRGVGFVPGIESPPTGNDIWSLAANDEFLFVSGVTTSGQTFIRRFEADRWFVALPTPRSDDKGLYQLKFDNEGTLWAAGPGLFKYRTSDRTWETVWPPG